jgi:hypothetical protein
MRVRMSRVELGSLANPALRFEMGSNFLCMYESAAATDIIAVDLMAPISFATATEEPGGVLPLKGSGPCSRYYAVLVSSLSL